jgi:hypothetical protein
VEQGERAHVGGVVLHCLHHDIVLPRLVGHHHVHRRLAHAGAALQGGAGRGRTLGLTPPVVTCSTTCACTVPAHSVRAAHQQEEGGGDGVLHLVPRRVVAPGQRRQDVQDQAPRTWQG